MPSNPLRGGSTRSAPFVRAEHSAIVQRRGVGAASGQAIARCPSNLPFGCRA